jgi:hypothetical protein
LLTEIDIPNPDGGLSPGIYCTIEFHIPRKTPSLSVPAEAIIFNRNEMQEAVVSDGKAEIPQLPRSAWFTVASRRSAGSINPFPSAISRGQTDKTSTAVELLMSEVD